MSARWLCCPLSPSSPFFLGCCSHNTAEMMGVLHGKDLVPQCHGAVPPAPCHCPCHHHTEPHRTAGSRLISLFPLPQGVQHPVEGFEPPRGQR